MAKYPIKLGRKMPSIKDMPVSSETSLSDEMHYPTLYLDWEKPYDLPDEGEITLKYKKVRETKTLRDGEMNHVEMDILEICAVNKGKDTESDDALDKLADESKEDGDY